MNSQAVAAQPFERSLDDPSAGQEFEALGGIGTLDDFERALADPGQRPAAWHWHSRRRQRHGAASGSAPRSQP